MRLFSLMIIVLLASCAPVYIPEPEEIVEEAVEPEAEAAEEVPEEKAEEAPEVQAVEEEAEEPEPYIEPAYDDVFALQGVLTGLSSDSLVVDAEDIYINGAVYEPISTINGSERRYQLCIYVDMSDQFLFIGDNMQNFFEIDLQCMTREELVITADILARYPEEGILELQEVY